MSGDHDRTKELSAEILEIRTKPCWICGQYSYINVPYEAWTDFDLHGVALDIAWPDGPAADKQLIITGVHLKCWDEEFPDDKKEQ